MDVTNRCDGGRAVTEKDDDGGRRRAAGRAADDGNANRERHGVVMQLRRRP